MVVPALELDEVDPDVPVDVEVELDEPVVADAPSRYEFTDCVVAVITSVGLPATLKLAGVNASITSMSFTVTAFTNISLGADLISYKSPKDFVGSVGTTTTEFTMSPISL